ncbi:MAG: hypothetical protein OSJ68_08155, partial [Clostridia bacterium]|nr:hypothetical protein [Clostridia bacterium]
TVNSTYHIGTVEVYLKYASYYTETDSEGNVVHKGKRENITGAEFDKITFMINGALAEGYTLSENDVPSCKVDVSYRYGGNNYFGEYYLTVNTARPSAISINGIDDYLNAKYYVGGKLDISKMTFTVKFQGFADGTIDASAVTYDLGALNLPTTEGPYTITFRYFDVSTTLTINVLPKEEIAVKFESKTYKYTGEEIKIVVTQDNGQPLPEGITYQFVDKHGNVITSLKEIGEYELTVKFTVDESVYLPIADVSATISVKKIAAMLDESKLIKPVDKRVYNGEQFPYELDGISIIEENGDTEYKFINVTYTITRDGKPVTELVVDKAGVYKIVAKIQFEAVTGELAGETQFLEKEYTITVDRAKNEIFSFKIDSWIVDTAQKDPVINAKFGTANIVYFTSEGVELGVTRPSSLGNYYAIATIPSCESYDEVTARCDFSINKASIGAVDDEGNELVDETGKPKYEVTGENGVDPSLTFKVEKWADDYDSSYVKVNRKLMVVAGYGICFVDGEGKEVFVEGTHTVRILIDEALRNEKKLYIYTVDEQGNVIDLDARREGDYLVFDTDDFSKDFVVACRDAAAAQRMVLIIGVSVGAIIAIAVVIALIVVFVKKKKEND